MITEIKLENFKGIKKGSLKFSNLTILLGANNSGKTTILESLYLLPNPFREAPYILGGRRMKTLDVVHFLHETLDSQGYSFLQHNYLSEIAKINVIEDDFEKELRFIEYSDGRNILLETHESLSARAPIEEAQIKDIGRISKGSKSIGAQDMSILTEQSLLISQNLIKNGFEFLERNWASIMNRGIGIKVAKEASQFSNDEYTDITLEPFLEGYSSINAYFKDGKRIRLGDLGEGIQNFIVAKMLYEIEKPQLLLWDDLEAHLNPRMILSIADWFADLISQKKQIIITTHSLETVKMISGIIDDSRITLMNVNNGILESKSMNYEEFDNITKKGIDPRVSERFLL